MTEYIDGVAQGGGSTTFEDLTDAETIVGTAGKVWRTNAGETSLEAIAQTGGGDVSAAANITATAVVVGDDGVKGVKETGVLIDASNNITGLANIDGRDVGTDGGVLDGVVTTHVTDATTVAAAGAVMDVDFTAADEIMVGTGAGTHNQITLAASQFLAKKAAGAATNVTVAEALTMLNVADGADVTGSNAPQAHKDSHDPNDGGDALDTAAAAEISAVVAAGAGTSHSLARADHVHAINHAITDNHIVTVDGTTNQPVNSDYAKFTANGLEGKDKAGILSDLNVADGADVTSTSETSHADVVVDGDFAANVAAFLATPSSANLITAVTGETGTGSLVFATSPTLVTPALGTPSAAVLTNATGLPVSGLAAGTDGELITWDAAGAAAVVAVGTATHVLTSNGVGVAPTFQAPAAASGDIATDTIWDAAGDLVYGTGSDTAARLAAGATTEILVGGGAAAPVWTTVTGTGAPVKATSPTLVTPALGTPASGVLSGCTGYPLSALTGAATLISLEGITIAAGTLIYGTAADTVAALAAGATTEILVGGGAAVPVWTTATGSGAPARATSPTLVTPILGTPTSGTLTNCDGYPAATSTTSGIVELATDTEVDTGDDTTRAITCKALADSNYGIRYVMLTCVEYATAVSVADGIAYFSVPAGLNGMNLVSVTGKNITAATGTGSQTTTIEVYNLTDTSQMLSTELTIDEDELTSATAAAAVAINAAFDDVATDDTIQINVSAIPSGAPEGLIVTLGFALP